jgi:hypothetical protein
VLYRKIGGEVSGGPREDNFDKKKKGTLANKVFASTVPGITLWSIVMTMGHMVHMQSRRICHEEP